MPVRDRTFSSQLVQDATNQLGYKKGVVVELSFVDQITPESSDTLTGNYMNPVIQALLNSENMTQFSATGNTDLLPTVNGEKTLVPIDARPD